ncbi:MAG: Hpt domain-containing protein [Candidatus Limnocylindrales bacterium]
MPQPAIDPVAFADLLENVGGDREFMAELVRTYLADSPARFVELRTAIASGDAAAARRAAHSLKSTSASMGASKLSRQCRELEMAAAAGTLAGLEASVDAAEAEYALAAGELGRLASAGADA